MHNNECRLVLIPDAHSYPMKLAGPVFLFVVSHFTGGVTEV